MAASTERRINQRITTKSLQEAPFILREKGSGTRETFEQYLHLKGLTIDNLNVTAILGSSTAVSEAIKSNLGVSILSRHAIREGIKNGLIQTIDILNMEMTRQFYTVNLKKRSLPHHYQVFLNYLLEQQEVERK